MENLLIRNILNLGNEEQGLWKTDACFLFFEDKISLCDLRVTNGCYIYLGKILSPRIISIDSPTIINNFLCSKF